MENTIIRIAAKFQYKIPSLRTLAVIDTISWSRGRPHGKSWTFQQRVVVDDHTYDWVYFVLRPSISSLLQSKTSVITKCDNFTAKCDRTYGHRNYAE